MGANVDTVMIVVTFATALWWGFSRKRRPDLLHASSMAAFALAAATLVVEGLRWQLVAWQVLALAVLTAAALRRWRPGHSRRWRRVLGRVALSVGVVLATVPLLTAFAPDLPRPSGPHRVASTVFRWSDETRPETLTADPTDRRQVIAQAWYPTDATKGDPVPYFEAQRHLPGSIGGLPSFMFASFGSVDTHAIRDAAISRSQRWPVLLFLPGLAVPREEYTALCAELASRGYVVVALSLPYESAVSVLANGRVVGQTTHPDVMGPPPHPAIERLIDIRSADSSFVLDELARLPHTSPLAGHLDLQHVGIVGHSIGGATAVQVMAGDSRFTVGVNLDGKLFGAERTARLRHPFLWIQSGDTPTAEYTEGRDTFLGGLKDGGELVVFDGTLHMSFTDNPAYLTSVGRRLAGVALGTGSISLARMTFNTADVISAYVGPALAITNGPTLHEIIVRDPSIRETREIAARVS